MTYPHPAIAGLTGIGMASQSYLLGITKENEDYWKLFATGKYTAEDYKNEGENFKYLSSFYQALLSDVPGLLDETDGNIRVPKWAVKAVAEAFQRYAHRTDIEHDLEATLEESFGIQSESKKETIKKLQQRNKKRFLDRVNMVRMVFGLNVNDAVAVTWKIVQWQKNNKPGFYYNFRASQKSMLDAYHRAYPLPTFMEWVQEWSQLLGYAKTDFESFKAKYLKWIEERVPEAATFIKRKIRLRNPKTDTETTCGG